MSKFIGIISLTIGGIIVADILIHPERCHTRLYHNMQLQFQ